MDINVSHTPTGRCCIVCLSDNDTVLDMKTQALESLFGDAVDKATEAAGLVARIECDERDDAADDLDDAQRIADTRLEGGDGVQLLWRWVRVKSPAEYSVDSYRMSSLGVSLCGRFCAILTSHRFVFIFDTATAEKVAQLRRSDEHIDCIAFSRCDRWLAAGSCNNSIYIWCTSTWQFVKRLQGHTKYVTSQAWTHCGRLVSGSADKTLRVWDVEEGVCTAVLKGHTDNINGVVTSPTSIFSGSADATIRVWSVSSLELTETLTDHARCVRHIAITANGCHLVSTSDDRSVKVWCTESLSCLRTMHTQKIMPRVAVSREGDVVAASGAQYTILSSLSTGKRLGTHVHECTTYVTTVGMSPCGRWLFTPGNQSVCVGAVADVQDVDVP